MNKMEDIYLKLQEISTSIHNCFMEDMASLTPNQKENLIDGYGLIVDGLFCINNAILDIRPENPYDDDCD